MDARIFFSIFRRVQATSMTQRRVENTRVHFWTFSPVSVNELKIFRALGLSTLAFELIGENIDFQSEIELVLSLLSKEYKNEIPKFLKVAAGRPEVLLGKTGQGRSQNLFIKNYYKTGDSYLIFIYLILFN